MPATIKILKRLFPEHCHDRVFLVGGSVRDFLLGKPGKDIDLAAALSEDEFTELGFRKVIGKSTEPIWFRHDPLTGTIEVIQLETAAALDDDLLRRDFSINAISMGLSGEIYDPLGVRRDLETRTIRPCSDMIFEDDPLRIFRAFRFAADGWQISDETKDLINKNDWSPAFNRIPVERFSREMLKALSSSHPERFFQCMLEFEIGMEYLPELFRMPGIPAGPLLHHPEGDLLTHSIQVLQRVVEKTDDPLTRFCALFHDIGKLATDPTLYPKHHGHDQAGFKPALSFCDRLRLPASYRTALAWVSRLHITFNLWELLRDSTRLRVAEQAIKAGIQDVLPVVSNADKPGLVNADEWRNSLRIAAMSTVEMGIDKQRLESLPESKRKDFILQMRVKILREQV